MTNIDKFFDSKEKIVHEIYRIQRIANALDITGNFRLSEELHKIQLTIDKETNNMRQCFAKEIKGE